MKRVVKRGWLAGALLAVAAAARGAWIFDGRPESWEGTPEELKVPPRTFPVLVLDLGGAWTDFELKASTNNFESLCYYVMSSGTNAWTSDPDVEIHFTDDCSADVRKWWKSAPGVSIGSQLADGVNSVVVRAVVAPSHTCTEDWETWMSRDNAALVWSYVRYDGIGLEMNATGTKSRWSAVVPVEWRPARIEP